MHQLYSIWCEHSWAQHTLFVEFNCRKSISASSRQDQFYSVFLLLAPRTMILDDLDQPVKHRWADTAPCPLQIVRHYLPVGWVTMGQLQFELSCRLGISEPFAGHRRIFLR